MRKTLQKIISSSLSLALVFFVACSPQLGHQFTGGFIANDLEIMADPALTEMVSPYKAKMEAEMSTIIGQSTKALTRSRGESLLGNFVADLQRAYAEQEFGINIDISIINNGGMRNDLPEGNITLGNIYELSPFDNYLVILELTAQDVQKLAEFMAARKNMAVSGMEIIGEGNQVQSFKVNGQALDSNKVYLLAINDYLANGGDNMDFLTDLPVRENTDLLLRDMLIQMIKAKTARGEKLDAQIEGRQKYN